MANKAVGFVSPVADGGEAHLVDTAVAYTSGELFVFKSNGAQKSAIGHDGALLLGATDNYALRYNSGATQLELRSTDVDGIGTDGDIFTVQDGTDDVVFGGSLTITGNGIDTPGTLSFTNSVGGSFSNPAIQTSGARGGILASSSAAVGGWMGIESTGGGQRWYIFSTASSELDIGRTGSADVPAIQITSAKTVIVGKGSGGDTYFGDGITDATPAAHTINATGGSGTDIAGANLTLAGGRGTGTGVGGSILFQTALQGTTGSSLNALATALEIDEAANIVPGTGALATTATDGFLYLPTCAGTPTGTPTAYTGRAPFIYDSTNNALYVYDGGWLSVSVT